jgi:AraC family transcriptional regulator, transcriptional activator of pobA
MLQPQLINVIIKQSASIDGAGFEVNEFKRQPLQQIVPFKNSCDQHFAIILYSGSMNEYSNITENNADQSGYLIFKSPGGVNMGADYRNISDGFYIQFTEEFLLRNRQLLSIITGFPFFEISLLKNKPLAINAMQSATIKELYWKIYEEYHCRVNNEKYEIMNAYLQAFFLHIKRIYESYSSKIESESVPEKRQSGDILQKFKSLVWLDTIGLHDKSITRKTVAEYAALLFIHPNYLNAVVKKETGKTARELIDEQIFKLAKNLLLKEELLIKEIAWQLAFTETAHFCNFFRRRAGIAPGAFRKQYLSEAA